MKDIHDILRKIALNGLICKNNLRNIRRKKLIHSLQVIIDSLLKKKIPTLILLIIFRKPFYKKTCHNNYYFYFYNIKII